MKIHIHSIKHAHSPVACSVLAINQFHTIMCINKAITTRKANRPVWQLCIYL